MQQRRTNQWASSGETFFEQSTEESSKKGHSGSGMSLARCFDLSNDMARRREGFLLNRAYLGLGYHCCEMLVGLNVVRTEMKDEFDLKGLKVRVASLNDRGLVRQQRRDTMSLIMECTVRPGPCY